MKNEKGKIKKAIGSVESGNSERGGQRSGSATCRAGKGGDVSPHSTQSGEGTRKRPPFERMKKIFGQLQDGKYPNCSTLAAEFAVSAKTAKRDIDFMRDRWELPIEYDPHQMGYYFTKPVDRFPGVPVTEKELFAFCVANKAIEQYQGTALQQPLELAFQKCMGQLDDQERFTLQNLDEAMSFRPFAPEDADLPLFELITEAIRERRGLQFEYRKPGEKVAERRKVFPYHLMQFTNRWYLLAQPNVGLAMKVGLATDVGQPANVGASSGIRKFVLGRMRAVTKLSESFTMPKDFDPKKYLDGSLGVMTGAGDYEVVIELDAWLTDVLRGRRWHPSQVWTELPGGGSHLRMRLSCLEEIEQWVLSWGTRATVLQPTALRERVGNAGRAIAARYAVAV